MTVYFVTDELRGLNVIWAPWSTNITLVGQSDGVLNLPIAGSFRFQRSEGKFCAVAKL